MFKALPGGHAVLLACGCPAGRTSLLRLVTHLADYKVFLLPCNLPGRRSFEVHSSHYSHHYVIEHFFNSLLMLGGWQKCHPACKKPAAAACRGFSLGLIQSGLTLKQKLTVTIVVLAICFSVKSLEHYSDLVLRHNDAKPA